MDLVTPLSEVITIPNLCAEPLPPLPPRNYDLYEPTAAPLLPTSTTVTAAPLVPSMLPTSTTVTDVHTMPSMLPSDTTVTPMIPLPTSTTVTDVHTVPSTLLSDTTVTPLTPLPTHTVTTHTIEEERAIDCQHDPTVVVQPAHIHSQLYEAPLASGTHVVASTTVQPVEGSVVRDRPHADESILHKLREISEAIREKVGRHRETSAYRTKVHRHEAQADRAARKALEQRMKAHKYEEKQMVAEARAEASKMRAAREEADAIAARRERELARARIYQTKIE